MKDLREEVGNKACILGKIVKTLGEMGWTQIFYSQYDSRYVGCHWLRLAPFLCTNLIGQGPELHKVRVDISQP